MAKINSGNGFGATELSGFEVRLTNAVDTAGKVLKSQVGVFSKEFDEAMKKIDKVALESVEKRKKEYDKQIDLLKQYYRTRSAERKLELEDELKDLGIILAENENIANRIDAIKQQKADEEAYRIVEQNKATKESAEMVERVTKNLYRNMNSIEKDSYNQQAIEQRKSLVTKTENDNKYLHASQLALNKRIKDEKEKNKTLSGEAKRLSDEKIKQWEEEYKAFSANIKANKSLITASNRDIEKKEKERIKTSMSAHKQLAQEQQATINAQKELGLINPQQAAKLERENRKKQGEDLVKRKGEIDESYTKKVANKQAEIEKAKASGNTAKQDKLQQQLDKILKEYDEATKEMSEAIRENTEQQKEDAKEEKKEKRKEAWKDSEKEAKNKTGAYLSGILNDNDKAVKNVVSTFYQYQAKMEARLQGSDTTYTGALSKITQSVGINPFVSQKSIVSNLQTLVSQGISYDVEARAFLSTISQDIASTFEVTNENLLRMIRLQRSDSTAQRLGMEAYLTKFYNSMFSDSSYLNSLFDSVQGAIFDASAQLQTGAAMEFEYIAQKWLGSLYSLGVSSEAINTIAQGLNYLGTGDVQALNNNEALTTLFAMSASRSANLEYADILINGLDASKTNELLQNMVEYLQEIAKDSKNNNVVTKAYTNILGISTSDLRAISNLSASDISNISENSLKYTEALQEYYNQTEELSSRIHLSQLVENLKDNALTTASIGLANNPINWGLFSIASLIKDITGGIAIPAISVFGSGIDLNTTVMDLVIDGMIGLSLFGELIAGLTKGGSGPFDLETWGYTDAVASGSVPKIPKAGEVFEDTSQDYEFTSNGDDMEETTLAGASKKAKSQTDLINGTNPNDKDHTFEDFWDAIYESNDQYPIPVKVVAPNPLPVDIPQELLNNVSSIASTVRNIYSLLGNTSVATETQASELVSSIDESTQTISFISAFDNNQGAFNVYSRQLDDLVKAGTKGGITGFSWSNIRAEDISSVDNSILEYISFNSLINDLYHGGIVDTFSLEASKLPWVGVPVVSESSAQVLDRIQKASNDILTETATSGIGSGMGAGKSSTVTTSENDLLSALKTLLVSDSDVHSAVSQVISNGLRYSSDDDKQTNLISLMQQVADNTEKIETNTSTVEMSLNNIQQFINA